jgi:hypothetical protein
MAYEFDKTFYINHKRNNIKLCITTMNQNVEDNERNDEETGAEYVLG